MKKIKTIILLLLTAIILTACANNEVSTNTDNVEVSTDNIAKTEKPKPIYDEVIVTQNETEIDKIRREKGFSDEYTIDNMIEIHVNSPNRSNILFGYPVKVIGGGSDGEINNCDDDGYETIYLFKITNNLTGNDLPEYIEVKSQLGDVMVLGNEYCISTGYNFSTLWNTHGVGAWSQIMSRVLVSDDDIEKIKKAVASIDKKDNADVFFENASTSSDFIEAVDLAVVITIKSKEKEERGENIFDITFDVNDVLSGKKYEKLIKELETIRINCDVEIGGTYLVMLEVAQESFVLPSSRNGAIVSAKSSEFKQYENAFSEYEAS
jgi:hypothetical protein